MARDVRPLRAAFDYFRPKSRPFDFDMEIRDADAADDPETVRRAAAILEAYVGKSSLVALSDARRGTRDDGERGMSSREALEVLGLETGADEAAVRAAHKRLLGIAHQARDTLLASSREWESPGPRNRAAKR
jgi:hypothetical protein